jgi:hypothetical protein
LAMLAIWKVFIGVPFSHSAFAGGLYEKRFRCCPIRYLNESLE